VTDIKVLIYKCWAIDAFSCKKGTHCLYIFVHFNHLFCCFMYC
jgi:hypothetical protein